MHEMLILIKECLFLKVVFYLFVVNNDNSFRGDLLWTYIVFVYRQFMIYIQISYFYESKPKLAVALTFWVWYCRNLLIAFFSLLFVWNDSETSNSRNNIKHTLTMYISLSLRYTLLHFSSLLLLKQSYRCMWKRWYKINLWKKVQVLKIF